MKLLDLYQKGQKYKEAIGEETNMVGGTGVPTPVLAKGITYGCIKKVDYIEKTDKAYLKLFIEFNTEGVIKTIVKNLFVSSNYNSEYVKTLEQLLEDFKPENAYDSNQLIGKVVKVMIGDRPYKEGFISNIDEIMGEYTPSAQDFKF